MAPISSAYFAMRLATRTSLKRLALHDPQPMPDMSVRAVAQLLTRLGVATRVARVPPAERQPWEAQALAWSFREYSLVLIRQARARHGRWVYYGRAGWIADSSYPYLRFGLAHYPRRMWTVLAWIRVDGPLRAQRHPTARRRHAA